MSTADARSELPKAATARTPSNRGGNALPTRVRQLPDRSLRAITTVLPDSQPLIGRTAELELLFELVDRLPERGGALVVRGEPGIGKTSLLGAASRHATDGGVEVLSALG